MTVMVLVLSVLVFGVGYPLLALHQTRRPRPRRAPTGSPRTSRWWETGDGGGDGGDGASDGGCDGGCDGGGGDGGCD